MMIKDLHNKDLNNLNDKRLRTYNLIDRKDLGTLRAMIDWDDNRQLYIACDDFINMTNISINQIHTDESYSHDGIMYMKANYLISLLDSNDKVRFWLEKDILPCIPVMNYGTFIKL